MSENGSMSAEFKLSSFQDPGSRYSLGDVLGSGVNGEVFEATDSQLGDRRVAIKIQNITADTEEDVKNEYNILRNISSHPNLPDFYGVYLKKATSRSEDDKIWFVMELCEGGPVTDLVRGLQEKNRRMSEEHIAYILREIVKVLVHLHENQVMHRDVKGSNILLTRDGEVKLVDFGLSRTLKKDLDKRGTYVGSPCWMAPEIIANAFKEGDKLYDSRIDVWALGITAIELGDGKAPFLDIHPTRALFQIVRNPPPTLYRPANWTQLYNDFIAECLEKNPEHRPFIMELLEHPFITGLPENDYHLSQELKQLIQDFSSLGRPNRKTEFAVKNGFLKTGLKPKLELMHQEDLAALEKPNEDMIVQELHERLKEGHFYTFVGDVLIALNPNEEQDINRNDVHAKYQFKARSDNPPHIFSVADRAYQDVMHHEEHQYILLAGETLSGKTTNMLHLLKHLLFLGQSPNKIGDNVDKATSIIHALANATTPFNPNSTRHVLQLELTFTATGKVSGAIFWLYQLEKWRVTTTNRGQANFHIFYYFYDAMEASGRLKQYNLDGGRKYRYLRTEPVYGSSDNSHGPREDPTGNVDKFSELEQQLRDIGFEDDQLDTLCNLIAAILIIGEITFKQGSDNQIEVEYPDVANKVAQLLSIDEKKFSWALINYCIVEKGTATRQRHTKQQAEEARDVLARAIYFRLVDWIVNVINHKLHFTRGVFGHKYSITLMDLFGFECYKKNGLEQLFVNTLNEQLQYHYNQRVFVWEMQEEEEEGIPLQKLQFYDNKLSVDELMNKPDGFFYLMDEASRTGRGSEFILGSLEDKKPTRLKVVSDHEFSVAHYTGKVTYNTRNMANMNREFLPPEMIDVLRLSSDKMVKLLFTNQLSRTGNLIMSAEDCGVLLNKAKKKWGAALMVDNTSKARRYQPETQGQYSQAHQMRTAAAMYRSTSLDILRGLAIGPGSGGTHFVRCIRADLTGQPKGFQPDVVRQQLRAMAIVDTAHARQIGFPHRVPFPEFLRRYKFLAFDFDETVDVTKENSRLLLVRLKMEGWAIGKSKVFLKYYNEEYLSRAYEIQVKKIVKVQTMMRAFLAKRNVASKLLKLRRKSSVDNDLENETTRKENSKNHSELTEEDASVIIQKQFRGYRVRKQIGPVTKRKLDGNTLEFIKEYCRKWKARTVFQVLLMYRAARQQDLVYFSQQVHLYNQTSMNGLSSSNKKSIPLDKVECGARASLVLGKRRPTVWKRPFHFDNDLPYFDTAYLNDPMTSSTGPPVSLEDEMETWDAPLRRGNSVPWRVNRHSVRDKEVQTQIRFTPTPYDNFDDENYTEMPFCRDPSEQISSQYQKQKKKFDNQNQQKESSVQTSSQKYDYPKKKVEVYNPGKIKRLEQQKQEFDNRSREWENNNILQDSVPSYKRSTSPIPQPMKKTPFNNNYNKNIQEENNWGTNKQLYSSNNQHNRQSTGTGQQFINRGGGFHLSKNPIAEMELKGKRQDRDNENDEPPFNFQAMLRKTNTNRASLRRAHKESPTKETQESYYNKNAADNRCDSRSSSIVYNSKPTSPTPSQTSRESSNANYQWSRSDPKKSWNDNEHWEANEPKKSWDNNNQRNRSEIKKSHNNEHWNHPISEVPWNENTEFCRFDPLQVLDEEDDQERPGSKISWAGNEHQLRAYWNENETSRPESVNSWNKDAEPGNSYLDRIYSESRKETLTESSDKKSEKGITTTELVPGLIIEGQVADL